MSVILRAVVEDDLRWFFAHQSDEDAAAMAAVDSRDQEAFRAHWSRLLADGSVYKRTVVVEGRVAGNVLVFDRDGRREIGYWFGRSFWGHGVATQAVAAALSEVADRPLYAWVATHNPASRRVLEKCGFAEIAEEPGSSGRGVAVPGTFLRLL